MERKRRRGSRLGGMIRGIPRRRGESIVRFWRSERVRGVGGCSREVSTVLL